MDSRHAPAEIFSQFLPLFEPKNWNVTVTCTKFVQFTTLRHPSLEHLVEILQYSGNTLTSAERLALRSTFKLNAGGQLRCLPGVSV